MQGLPIHEINEIIKWLGPISRCSLRAIPARSMLARDALFEELGQYEHTPDQAKTVIELAKEFGSIHYKMDIVFCAHFAKCATSFLTKTLWADFDVNWQNNE